LPGQAVWQTKLLGAGGGRCHQVDAARDDVSDNLDFIKNSTADFSAG
jgi:hypothetical protein